MKYRVTDFAHHKASDDLVYIAHHSTLALEGTRCVSMWTPMEMEMVKVLISLCSPASCVERMMTTSLAIPWNSHFYASQPAGG